MSPRKEKQKKAIVIRLAAFGDAIIVTPIFRLLKEEGYYVTFHTSKWGAAVTRNNPFIDEWSMHDHDIPPDERLEEYFKKVGEGYDRVINLCESIEGTLAKVEWREDFHWSQEKRHKECDKNFYDHALELAGFDERGLNGELYFSKLEERLAKQLRQKYKGKFLVLWSLSGSSVHKAYPYTEYVQRALLNKYPDMWIMTIGDGACAMIELSHPRVKNYSGSWPIRKSLIMTKYVDLVVGPDTGIMHAAGCYDTPKILMLSSNTEENLSKHWENCTNLVPPVDCHPCHRLHYNLNHCPLDETLKTPVCMSKLKARDVFDAVEKEYMDWKVKRRKHGRTNSTHADLACN